MLLTFCAMTLLIVLLYGLDDYNDFRQSIMLENIEERVAADLFAARERLALAPRRVLSLAEGGPIWIDMPIPDLQGTRIGRLRILYLAEFDLGIQLRSIFDFLLYVWGDRQRRAPSGRARTT